MCILKRDVGNKKVPEVKIFTVGEEEENSGSENIYCYSDRRIRSI